MGYQAWDDDVKMIVDADNCVKKGKGHYLCPTKECRKIGIPVYLAGAVGDEHFRTMPGYATKHHAVCSFSQAKLIATMYRHKRFVDFQLDNLVLSLTSPIKNSSSKRSVKSVKNTGKTSGILSPDIVVDNINKLYNLLSSNNITHNLTPTLTVGDICRDERNAGSHKKEHPDNVSLMIIGKTNGLDYKEKMLRVVCKNTQMKPEEAIKVYIYFDEESYLKVKNRLEKFNSRCKDVSVAVLGRFTIRKKINTATNKLYDASSADCNSRMIKILDRITP